MTGQLARLHPRPARSLTRADLLPDLGIASGAVAAGVVVHMVLLSQLGQHPPLLLFAAVCAALTFWCGFGPGMLASALSTGVSSSLTMIDLHQFAMSKVGHLLESSLFFGESLFICWLIYRLRVAQETTAAVYDRRDAALSFVSHELRHPLANIQLAATMLQRDPSDQSRDRAATLILRSAQRLGRVIDDLVDLARLHSDTLTIKPGELVLQDVIAASVELAVPLISKRQQFLQVELGPNGPLRVHGDSERLQQVFGNLLANASQYSQEGAEISIAAHARDGRAVVVVRDTGLGIRRDMLERIFEPFVRESGSSAEGLGIGLTLARTIIERHGGAISARSDGPGRGSEFSVELPLLPSGIHTLNMATP
jgi:signal transduction histidine kinase